MRVIFSLAAMALQLAIASHSSRDARHPFGGGAMHQHGSASPTITTCRCVAERPRPIAPVVASSDCPKEGPLCLSLGRDPILGFCIYVGFCNDKVPQKME